MLNNGAAYRKINLDPVFIFKIFFHEKNVTAHYCCFSFCFGDR